MKLVPKDATATKHVQSQNHHENFLSPKHRQYFLEGFFGGHEIIHTTTKSLIQPRNMASHATPITSNTNRKKDISIESISSEIMTTGPRVEDGTFVYQVIRPDGVLVRDHPYAFATATTATDAFFPEEDHEEDDDGDVEEYIFQKAELVEVDQIVRHSDTVLVRLADHTGWIAAEWQGEIALKQLPVERGLWTWYVDNFPTGVTIRRHPLDSAALLPTEQHQHQQLQHLWPLQKIYCDARVVHPITGVAFYRLQSSSHAASHLHTTTNSSGAYSPVFSQSTDASTPSIAATVNTLTVNIVMTMNAIVISQGWVYDRTPRPDTEDLVWLLEESSVQTGKTWVYRALEDIIIHTQPNVASNCRRPDELRIPAGDMVAVSTIRESPYGAGNGPFLQLSDGSGWLFEYRRDQKIMEAVPTETGIWECRVLNKPVGIGLRRNPMDGQEQLVPEMVFPYQSALQCDLKVTNRATGVSHYRVQGTDGWVMDRRDDSPMLKILSSITDDLRCNQLSPLNACDMWNSEFVRGIAATVEGLTENAYYPHGRVLSFRTSSIPSMEFTVYLSTRTVVREIEHPVLNRTIHSCHRSCSAKDLLVLFQKSTVDVLASALLEENENDLREEKKDDEFNQIHDQRSERGEEELRQEILRTDEDIHRLLAKRRELLQRVASFDEIRARQARDRTIRSPVIPQVEGELMSGEDDDDDDDSASGTSSDGSTHSGSSKGSAGASELIDSVRSVRSSMTSKTGKGEITTRSGPGANRVSGESGRISSAVSLRNSMPGRARVKDSPFASGLSVISDISSSTAGLNVATAVPASASFVPTIDENNELDYDVARKLALNDGFHGADDDGSEHSSRSRRVGHQYICEECKIVFNGKYSRDIHCREVHNVTSPR